MTKKLSLVVLALVLGLVGAACGTADASGPPEINYGRDICVECGMIISEARFAAAYRLADGTEKIFDDLGGLLLASRETGDHLGPATTWVHDFETEEWVAVEDAYFVPTLSVASPMGHSIISFNDKARAEAFAADVDGEVIGWDIVKDLPAMEGLVGHHHDDDHEGHDMGSDG
jgi:copper chaperone NosL